MLMNQAIKTQLDKFYQSIKNEPKYVLGLPGNMIFDSRLILPFFDFLLNNVGDPFEDSNYKLHSKKFEKEVLKFFAQLYGLKTTKEYWGYITTGGTEGNMHGLLNGRENYPNGILYFSEDTHYSIEKLAKILRMDYKIVKSQKNGEVDYNKLSEEIKKNIQRPVILNLNIGTTFKGAIDSVEKVLSLLKKLKVKEFYIHCDAALFGGFLPYVVPKSSEYNVDFSLPINSISISGHKFIGSPMPCGIFLTRNIQGKTINKKIKYIDASDTTISGSRNGHTTLFLWYAIKTKGYKGFKNDALQGLENAQYLKDKLNDLRIRSLLNLYSNILVFDKPSKKTCNKWQLSVVGKKTHAVIMPHVTKKTIDKFIKDIE
jgi:histidine decarboxylase